MDQIQSGDVIEIEFRGFFTGAFRVIDAGKGRLTLTPEDSETESQMMSLDGDWDYESAEA